MPPLIIAAMMNEARRQGLVKLATNANRIGDAGGEPSRGPSVSGPTETPPEVKRLDLQ